MQILGTRVLFHFHGQEGRRKTGFSQDFKPVQTSDDPTQGNGFTTTATIQTGFTAEYHTLLSHAMRVRESNCGPWQVTTDNYDTPVFCDSGLKYFR
jgi:hypothetical protein